MTYSINTLEKISGIKAHTLRIWELRYQLLEPHRTATNIRYYDDEQLKKLLNVVLLLQNGHKISKVSQLTRKELLKKVAQIQEAAEQSESGEMPLLHQFIQSALNFDVSSFEKAFAKMMERYPFEKSYPQFLLPLMRKVGHLWRRNKISPAQEHFISQLIRQKLMVAIEALPLPKEKFPTWLLFLPPNEHHDIALLYAYYLLRKCGRRVLFLGSNVPIEEVKMVANRFKVLYGLTFFITHSDPVSVEKQLSDLRSSSITKQLLVAGNESLLTCIRWSDGISWLKEPKALHQFMT